MAIKPQEKIADLKKQRMELTRQSMRIHLNLQRIQERSTVEVSPHFERLERLKGMRDELVKMTAEDLPAAVKDTEDRKLKEEIAACQKEVDDRLAILRNLDSIEREDLKALDTKVKVIDDGIALWTRLEGMFPAETPAPVGP